MSGPGRLISRLSEAAEEEFAAARNVAVREAEALQGEERAAAENAAREAEDAQAGVREGAHDVEEAAQANRPLPKTEGKSRLATAKAFGKFVGEELAKGVLMAAGMEAVDAIVKKLESNAHDAKEKAMYDKVHVINDAWKDLKAVKTEWYTWMAGHYSSKKSFGSVDVSSSDGDSESIPNYDRVDTKLEKLTEFSTDNFDKALKAAEASLQASSSSPEKANKDVAVLLYQAIKYAEKQDALAIFIDEKQSAMKTAGLKPNKDKVEAAKKKMTDVQTEEDKKITEALEMENDEGKKSSGAGK